MTAIARAPLTLAAVVTAGALCMLAQGVSFDVKANYVKREVFIPMRDGVKLFTILYTPKDATKRYPLLMTRTAYGIAPYGPDNYRG